MPKTLPRATKRQTATVPPASPKAPPTAPQNAATVPEQDRVALPAHVVSSLLGHLHRILYPVVPEGGNALSQIVEERAKALGLMEGVGRFLGVADKDGLFSINLSEQWVAPAPAPAKELAKGAAG